MNNRNYYLFDRNKYYYGKLLTSKDFQNEQDYMNNKRRIGNRLLHGIGIVQGMDVVAADTSSLILQSGMALDAGGREIVVPETRVIKLSTIDGYNDLKTGHVYLGIEYAEEEIDPVYAVMGTEADNDGKQYNRLKEGFRLFLRDAKDCVKEDKKEDLYLTSKILYQDEDLLITQYLPAFAVPGMMIKTRTEIKKCSHVPSVYSFSCKVSANGFNPGEAVLRTDNISPDFGETAVIEKFFEPEAYIFGHEDVKFIFDHIEVQKSGVTENVPAQEFVVEPVNSTILEHVLKTGYRGTMDVEMERRYDEKLWIAEIHLLRSEQYAIIDRIDSAPFEQYVYNAEDLMILEKLHTYMEKPAAAGVVEADRTEQSVMHTERMPEGRRTNSSGVFEMSLGTGGEAGKVYFSDEVMHGLGNGPVYVEIGIEYISRDAATKLDRESIILGDGSIFASDESLADEKILQIDQAVRLLPDRGTFIVGIRPKVKLGKIGVRIRWYAFKPEDLEQRVYNIKDQKGCIMIQPDTIVLPPKSSIHIAPVFINMPEEALSYTLLDPEGGKIDNNGLYTAPAQEGVYEIKASAISDPKIYTHAFIIVSQKKTEE